MKKLTTQEAQLLRYMIDDICDKARKPDEHGIDGEVLDGLLAKLKQLEAEKK